MRFTQYIAADPLIVVAARPVFCNRRSKRSDGLLPFQAPMHNCGCKKSGQAERKNRAKTHSKQQRIEARNRAVAAVPPDAAKNTGPHNWAKLPRALSVPLSGLSATQPRQPAGRIVSGSLKPSFHPFSGTNP
jgi:hypothetical protein